MTKRTNNITTTTKENNIKLDKNYLANVAAGAAVYTLVFTGVSYVVCASIPKICKGVEAGKKFVSEKLANRKLKKHINQNINENDEYDWEDEFVNGCISDEDLYDEDEDFREDIPQTPYGNEESDSEEESEETKEEEAE